MRLINDGLPDPLYQAILHDTYDRGDSWASVTSLEDAPRIRLMLERHPDVEVNASEQIFAFMGKALHAAIETGRHDNSLKEERLFADVAGKRISGAFDLYDGTKGILWDMKFPSVWVYIFEKGKAKAEWAWQVNDLSYLLELHGFPVEQTKVAMTFRDWTPSEQKKMGRDYPHRSVQVAVPKLPFPDRLSHLEERVRLHAAAEALPDVELPMCTEVERWTKPTKYAVMKEGRKSALRVLDTFGEAHDWMASNGGTHVQPRPGEDTRCLSFCAVRSICSHGRAVAAAQNGTSDGE